MINHDFLMGYGAGKAAGGGGGGGGGTLLQTIDLGEFEITTTSGNTQIPNKYLKFTKSEVAGFDELLLIVTRDSFEDNLHYKTLEVIYLTLEDGVATNDVISGCYNTWKDSGVVKKYYYSTQMGVFVTRPTLSGDTFTGSFYGRRNDTNTGPINGKYTAELYGVVL